MSISRKSLPTVTHLSPNPSTLIALSTNQAGEKKCFLSFFEFFNKNTKKSPHGKTELHAVQRPDSALSAISDISASNSAACSAIVSDMNSTDDEDDDSSSEEDSSDSDDSSDEDYTTDEDSSSESSEEEEEEAKAEIKDQINQATGL